MTTKPHIPSLERCAEIIDYDLDRWHGNCHGVALAFLKVGLVKHGRMARGFAKGVTSQHSWVVVGDDCYDPDAWIVDPTLWTYRMDVSDVWIGTIKDDIHVPHGYGSIWTYGKPQAGDGDPVELAVPVSDYARKFLKTCFPKGADRQGWAALMHAPVGGWPAAEIVAAMDDTPELAPLVPIDLLGMLTDRNPANVYLVPRPKTLRIEVTKAQKEVLQYLVTCDHASTKAIAAHRGSPAGTTAEMLGRMADHQLVRRETVGRNMNTGYVWYITDFGRTKAGK